MEQDIPVNHSPVFALAIQPTLDTMLQAFGLGGLIASFGLVLDLIGFVLLLLFVLVSSLILLRRETAVRYTSG